MRNQQFGDGGARPPRWSPCSGLVAGTMLVAISPAAATDISPVGLTQLKFQAGSYLDINFGLPTAQHFDLGPSTTIACSDGVENNDAAPLGTVGSGGGTDTLFDYYPADNSRTIVAGTATGGSTTTVVDTTATWTTNQWQGKSVWITAGAGSGGKAHIVSNTATTLTLNATNNNAPVGYIQGLAAAAAAGSEYHISTADPECASAADDNELANGLQPKENVVIVATIAANGTTSIPKTVRTSEASALDLRRHLLPARVHPRRHPGHDRRRDPARTDGGAGHPVRRHDQHRHRRGQHAAQHPGPAPGRHRAHRARHRLLRAVELGLQRHRAPARRRARPARSRRTSPSPGSRSTGTTPSSRSSPTTSASAAPGATVRC